MSSHTAASRSVPSADPWWSGASEYASAVKSAEQEIELKSYQRLRSLDEPLQEHISQKYYGGERPWNNGSSKKLP